MPVLLEGAWRDDRLVQQTGRAGGLASLAFDRDLTIGLVNNMPDAALQATERQFMSLLAAVAGERIVKVQLYSLPSVRRGEAASLYMRDCYSGIDTLDRDRPDALIVTGCEPHAASLADEPYWADMTRLVDWAARHTASTLWSCLAAHAAVLYRDGVGRHRLPAKRSGIFECEARGSHPLLAGTPGRLRVAHSRLNDLREEDLVAAGYEVLTAAAGCGVNLFAKKVGSLFVFFQGHPEYDPETIGREFRRDVARYLRGEAADYPAMPQNYFDEATTAALDAFRVLALADRGAVGLRDLPKVLALRPGLVETWGTSVFPVFRNWLDLVAAG